MQLALIFIIFLLLELGFFKIARIFNIVDRPNARSSHSDLIIRGGGIIFPLAAVYGYIKYPAHGYFITGLLLVSLISFWDDVTGVSNKLRLLVQFIAVGFLLYDTGLALNWYAWVGLIMLISIVINAFNFMDGINGMTGLYNFGLLASLAGTILYFDMAIDLQFTWIILIAVLVFLVFNFRKRAACFAGDVGSISIAFICCFLLIEVMIGMQSVIPALFIAVYCVDAIITIIFRLTRNENIFQAHRGHLYQVLANEYKIDHRFIAAGYFLIQALVNVWVLYAFKKQLPAGLVYLQVFFLLITAYLFLRIRLEGWKKLTVRL